MRRRKKLQGGCKIGDLNCLYFAPADGLRYPDVVRAMRGGGVKSRRRVPETAVVLHHIYTFLRIVYLCVRICVYTVEVIFQMINVTAPPLVATEHLIVANGVHC